MQRGRKPRCGIWSGRKRRKTAKSGAKSGARAERGEERSDEERMLAVALCIQGRRFAPPINSHLTREWEGANY